VNPRWYATAKHPEDPPLSVEGEKQALELLQVLKQVGITKILSSPYTRTVQTAKPIAEALSIPICIEYGLTEWITGHVYPGRSNKYLHKISSQVSLTYTSLSPLPSIESVYQLHKRCSNFVKLLQQQFDNNNNKDVFLLVGHAATVIAVLRAFVNDLTFECNPANCSLSKIVFNRKQLKWIPLLNADTSHLSTGPFQAWKFTNKYMLEMMKEHQKEKEVEEEEEEERKNTKRLNERLIFDM